VVECEFTIGVKNYKIVRGIKPVVFEIWVDGQMIDQDAASKDYQRFLEENILKLNFKSFSQLVILGSASFVPFMQLPAAARRDVIEDILDIKIFSGMNVVLKQWVTDLKIEMGQIESKLELAKTKSELQLQ
jgi:DNA repair exonuclease SbcCD ATPase subunit